MKNRRKLIIISFLILLCSNVYSQSDTFMILNRHQAELFASRFDSLKYYKTVYPNCINALDTAMSLFNYAAKINTFQERKIAGLNEEIAGLNYIITSHKANEYVNTKLQQSLYREKSRKKAWRSVAITALSIITITSLSIILI